MESGHKGDHKPLWQGTILVFGDLESKVADCIWGGPI